MLQNGNVIAIDKNGEVNSYNGLTGQLNWQIELEDSLFQVSEAQSPITKEIYLNKIAQIHNLIYAGEVYELNYCVGFMSNFLTLSSSETNTKVASTHGCLSTSGPSSSLRS